MHVATSFRLVVIVPLAIMPTLPGKASYFPYPTFPLWVNSVTMGEQPFYLTEKVG
jgi:hypothetical protein